MKKGFTLIEMLLVIGIIGILAAVLLAAINPAEQINKANDSGKIDACKEIIGGIERYGATNTTYTPTCVAATAKLELVGNNEVKSTLNTNNIELCNCVVGSAQCSFRPSANVYMKKCVTNTSGCNTAGNCLVPDELQ